MALTAWEAMKVLGGTIEELGADAEAFEDANPGEKYKLSKGEIITKLTTVATKLGAEFLD